MFSLKKNFFCFLNNSNPEFSVCQISDCLNKSAVKLDMFSVYVCKSICLFHHVKRKPPNCFRLMSIMTTVTFKPNKFTFKVVPTTQESK